MSFRAPSAVRSFAMCFVKLSRSSNTTPRNFGVLLYRNTVPRYVSATGGDFSDHFAGARGFGSPYGSRSPESP